MQSLAAILKQHPPPWAVRQETSQEGGVLFYIKDANGKDVTSDNDTEAETLVGAVAQAVNIAALTREWRDARATFIAALQKPGTTPREIGRRNGLAAEFEAMNIRLAAAIAALDSEATHG